MRSDAGSDSSTTTANRSPAMATFAGSVVCAIFSNGQHAGALVCGSMPFIGSGISRRG
jgi:hypothetical protein